MSIIHKDIQRDLSDIALKTQNLMVVNDVLNKIEVIDPDIYVTYNVDSYYISSTNKPPTVNVRNVSLDTLKRIKQLLFLNVTLILATTYVLYLKGTKL